MTPTPKPDYNTTRVKWEQTSQEGFVEELSLKYQKLVLEEIGSDSEPIMLGSQKLGSRTSHRLKGIKRETE